MHLVLSPTYIGVQTISLKKIYKEKSFKNCKARKTSAKNYFGKKFLIYFLSVVMYMNAYAPAYILPTFFMTYTVDSNCSC